MPAVFLILDDKEIPLERNYRIKGGAAVTLALIALLVALLLVVMQLDTLREGKNRRGAS